MSISDFTFKTLLSRVWHRSGALPKFMRDPRFDWRAAFIVFIALNLISVVFHFISYKTVGNGEIFLVEKQETAVPEMLSRFELGKTVARFEEDRTRFDELWRKPISVHDPYIPTVVPKKK